MELAQIQRSVFEKKKLIMGTEREIGELMLQAIEHAPFKVGDKVSVKTTNSKVPTICFVSKITFREYIRKETDIFEYNFTLPKKGTGEMGMRGAGLFASFDQITKV